MTEQGHCPGSNSHTEQCTDLKDCSHHLVFMRRVGRPGATVAWVLINSCWAPGPQGPRSRPATLWMSSATQGRAQPYSPSVSDRHLHLHPTCELRKDVFCLLFLLQRRL